MLKSLDADLPFLYIHPTRSEFFSNIKRGDDFFTDGSRGILQDWIKRRERIRVLYHDHNRQKGVVSPKGTARTTRHIIFYDAGLEYDTQPPATKAGYHS
jgi:hypothetical protein